MPAYSFPLRWAVEWMARESCEPQRTIQRAWGGPKSTPGRNYIKHPARHRRGWSASALDALFPDLSGAPPLRLGRTATLYGATRAQARVLAGNRYRKLDLHMPEARWRRSWAQDWLAANDTDVERVRYRVVCIEVPEALTNAQVLARLPGALLK